MLADFSNKNLMIARFSKISFTMDDLVVYYFVNALDLFFQKLQIFVLGHSNLAYLLMLSDLHIV